jgi:hypothetical protein
MRALIEAIAFPNGTSKKQNQATPESINIFIYKPTQKLN